MTAVHTTWGELAASQPGRTEQTLVLVDGLPELLSELDDDWALAETLTGPTAGLACVAILEGPERTLELAAPLAPFFERALSASDSDAANMFPSDLLQLLQLTSLLRCCGLGEAAGAAGRESGWLETIGADLEIFGDYERQRLALAALAARRPDLVAGFAELGRLPTLEPGATFGFNVQGYAGHMAAAIEDGAGPDGVRPAWQEFVELFPRKLAAEALEWPDLLLAARTHYVYFEGEPIETVAARLHALVT